MKMKNIIGLLPDLFLNLGCNYKSIEKLQGNILAKPVRLRFHFIRQ